MSEVATLNIVGVKVPARAVMHEVTKPVWLLLAAAGGWNGKDRVKGLGAVSREKLMAMKELFRTKDNVVEISPVEKMAKYFGIIHTVPTDLIKQCMISGKKGRRTNMELRRVSISKEISQDRRNRFAAAIATGAKSRSWGARIKHSDKGTKVDLWWDGVDRSKS